jgi:hypothetical protein
MCIAIFAISNNTNINHVYKNFNNSIVCGYEMNRNCRMFLYLSRILYVPIIVFMINTHVYSYREMILVCTTYQFTISDIPMSIVLCTSILIFYAFSTVLCPCINVHSNSLYIVIVRSKSCLLLETIINTRRRWFIIPHKNIKYNVFKQ